MLTADLLRKIAQNNSALAATLVDPLNALMAKWDLTTPLRRAHFLAQCCYESGYFMRIEENLRYSADRIAVVFPAFAKRASLLAFNPEALGNAVYAGRFGNGDEASGDGYRYRGRGLLQHTFRANYQELAQHIGFDVLGNPDLLTQPMPAITAALYFFKSRGCIPLADADNAAGVTLRINGGSAGLTDRAMLKHRAMELGV